MSQAGALHVRTTELAQGQTTRWAVGWSFVPHAAPLLKAPSKAAVKECHLVAIEAGEAWRRALAFLSGCEDVQLTTESEEDSGEIATGCATSDGGAHRAQQLTGKVAMRSPPSSKGSSASSHALAPATKRSRSEGLAVDDHRRESPSASAPSWSPKTIFTFRLELHSRDATDPTSMTPFMRVLLETCTAGESGIAAFWSFADRLRNDVARDTRKWRRKAAK